LLCARVREAWVLRPRFARRYKKPDNLCQICLCVGPNIGGKLPNNSSMKCPRLHNDIRKALALVTAALILPALAYAGTDHGKGNNGQNNGQQKGQNNGKQKGQDKVPVVPEVNVGWVLVPFFGAVLFFSGRQLFRWKAAE